MYRYILFAGIEYYPNGGWKDFHSSSDNLEELKQRANEHYNDDYKWWHIVDMQAEDGTACELVASSD